MTVPGFVASFSIWTNRYFTPSRKPDYNHTGRLIPQQEGREPYGLETPGGPKEGDEVIIVITDKRTPTPETLSYEVSDFPGFAGPYGGGVTGIVGGGGATGRGSHPTPKQERCMKRYREKCDKGCESESRRISCMHRCYNKYSGPFAEKDMASMH